MHLSGFTYMNFLRLRFSFIYLFNAPQKVGTGHFHDRFISYFLYLNLRKLSAAKKVGEWGHGLKKLVSLICNTVVVLFLKSVIF